MHINQSKYIGIIVLLSLPYGALNAECCANMQGISYCDSSVGRYVCNSGDYSSCYCTIHAVMDMQKFAGCCVWQGGIARITETGIVLCNNGSASEICTLQAPHEKVAAY